MQEMLTIRRSSFLMAIPSTAAPRGSRRARQRCGAARTGREGAEGSIGWTSETDQISAIVAIRALV